jgi:Na+-driven multidrug efflux pump
MNSRDMDEERGERHSKMMNKTEIFEEYWIWGKISVLSAARFLTDLTPWLASLAFIGSRGGGQLEALSLVVLWIYTFLDIVWLAIGQTASVLISQADGAGSESAKHGWLTILLITMTVASSSIALIAASSPVILPMMTSDQELVALGSQYAFWIIPAIYFAGFQELTSTYFTATGHAAFSTVSSLFYSGLDVFFNYLFVIGAFGFKPYENGLIGVAMSWNVSSFLGLLLNLLFLYWMTGKETEEKNKEKEQQEEQDEENRIPPSSSSLSLSSSPSPPPSPAIERIDSLDSVDEMEEVVVPFLGAKKRHSFNQDHHKAPPLIVVALTHPEKRKRSSSSDYTYELVKMTNHKDDIESNMNHSSSHASSRSATHSRSGSLDIVDEEPLEGKDNENQHGQRTGDGDDDDNEEDAETIELKKETALMKWVFSKTAWKRLLAVFLPTLVTSATEYLIYFVLGLLVIRLSRAQIAAYNTCSAIIEYAFSIGYAMAEATSVRIGYYVGKGDYQGSITVVWISVITSLMTGIVFSIVCDRYSREIALIFTSDPKIIYYIVQLSPILYPTVAIFATGDQMLAILLGQGRSKIKMYLSLFSLWGITFPLAYYLFFFVGRELPEIWSSFSVGYIVLEVVAAYFVYYSDWEAVFRRAKQYATRMKEKNFA